MSKKMLIDATNAEETRVVVVDGNKVEEFDYENLSKRQLAGNIYLAKVTRVEPSLQAAFVDYGGNRHGFLAFSEIHPDYYQIPTADRIKLLEEEAAYNRSVAAADENDADNAPKKSRSVKRGSSSRSRKPAVQAEKTGAPTDPVVTGLADAIDIETDDDSSGLVDVPETSDGSELVAPLDAGIETVVSEPDAEQPEEAEQLAEDDSATAAPEQAEDPAEEAELPSEAEPAEDAEAATAEPEDESSENTPDEDAEVAENRIRKPRPRRYKIQEVIKVRQILLVQVVKEERGNKGAALTTYLSLAGRYCVLMPNTARGGGISRKITNPGDRKKLKEIAGSFNVPEGAGLIVRTAGSNRTKTEIKRDYEYLLRHWEQIRDLTLKSIAPCQIYEEGSLIKRSIRDLYNREIDEVLVEGETGYKLAKDYMKMLMPSHAKKVKAYADPVPLFARHQADKFIDGMFNPVVQLKSGGYLVIGITEALVAIDVNSGRSTRERSIENTALKTNLEAAEEAARQMRLRDLAGLIVIDFIDMEEKRNNTAVEKRLKESLKADRARIQIGRISGFGLLEMSRQRLRPGMIEATTAPCPSCHGTGIVRSDDSQALSILRLMEEEGGRKRAKEILVTVPVGVANYLLNQKRERIGQIEHRYGMAVRIEGDRMMISPDFRIERFKHPTRILSTPASTPVVSLETVPMDFEPEEVEETGAPTKKKRRRRRKRGGNKDAQKQEVQVETASGDGGEAGETPPEPQSEAADLPEADTATEEAKPANKRATSRKTEVADAENAEEKPAKAPKRRTRKTAAAKEANDTAETTEAPADSPSEPEGDAAEPVVKKAKKPARRTKKAATAEKAESNDEKAGTDVETPAEPIKVEIRAAEPAEEKPVEIASVEVVTPELPKKPKRTGWWSN